MGDGGYPSGGDGGYPSGGDGGYPSGGDSGGYKTPVDGGWSEWSTCTKSCGGGQKIRKCTNPTPANGGRQCIHDVYNVEILMEEGDCNNQKCPSSGGYPSGEDGGYPSGGDGGYPAKTTKGYPSKGDKGYPSGGDDGYPSGGDDGYPSKGDKGYPSGGDGGYPSGGCNFGGISYSIGEAIPDKHSWLSCRCQGGNVKACDKKTGGDGGYKSGGDGGYKSGGDGG